jgi:tetratricopeptide (TPR) repeat protein
MPNTLKALFLVFVVLCLSSLILYSYQDETAEILKGSDNAVVTLFVFDAKGQEINRGKAVLISSDGYLLTNYHLVCQAYSAKVEIPKPTDIKKKVDLDDFFTLSESWDSGRPAEGKKKKKPKGKKMDVEGICGVDKSLNLALLKIKGRGHPTAPIASSDHYAVGDKMLVIPDAESISEGSIIGVGEIFKTQKIGLISITFPEEMSGSPIFDLEGQLKGVAFSFGEVKNLVFPASYAVPLTESKKTTPLSKYAHEDYFLMPEGLYIKGLAYTLAEKYTAALGFIEESIRLRPDNSEALSQLGLIYSKLNQYEKAIDAYTRSLSLDPDNYKTSFGLGISYVRLRRHQEAILPLQKCTQINPNFPDAFYNLGLAYLSLEQLENAAKAYEQFVKINPGPAWTGLNQLGSIYMKLGQYDKAIAAFEEVVETNPQDIKANYSLAYACDMSGQYDKAAALYKNLIELNPNDAGSYYNMLFRLYDKAGDYENAVTISQEILNLAPEDAQNHYNQGYAYLKKEDLGNALTAFQRAVEINPNFDVAYSQIGFVHFKMKQYQEAIDALTKYTEMKPDNPDVYYLIGTSYLQLKKYEKALKPLEKCIEFNKDHAYAHYNLGIAYYVLKDRFSANMKVDVLQKLNPELAEKLRNIIKR